MASNNLEELPEETRAFCTRLRVLEASFNALESIPDFLVDGSCMRLALLDLRGNRITSVPRIASDRVPALTHLLLGINSITDIPKDTFKGALHLETIDFCANNIKRLPSDLFSACPNLLRFDASHNAIECLPSTISDAQNLTHLILSNNPIRQVPQELGKMHTLKVLDFSSNAIDSISDKSIAGLCNLHTLLLNDNHLTAIPAVDGLVSLVTFDVRCNRISELPRALSSLDKLENLYVFDADIGDAEEDAGFDVGQDQLDDDGEDLVCDTIPPDHNTHMSVESCPPFPLERVQNPIEFPPISVCRKGLVAIKAYLASNAPRHSTPINIRSTTPHKKTMDKENARNAGTGIFAPISVSGSFQLPASHPHVSASSTSYNRDETDNTTINDRIATLVRMPPLSFPQGASLAATQIIHILHTLGVSPAESFLKSWIACTRDSFARPFAFHDCVQHLASAVVIHRTLSHDISTHFSVSETKELAGASVLSDQTLDLSGLLGLVSALICILVRFARTRMLPHIAPAFICEPKLISVSKAAADPPQPSALFSELQDMIDTISRYAPLQTMTGRITAVLARVIDTCAWNALASRHRVAWLPTIDAFKRNAARFGQYVNNSFHLSCAHDRHSDTTTDVSQTCMPMIMGVLAFAHERHSIYAASRRTFSTTATSMMTMTPATTDIAYIVPKTPYINTKQTAKLLRLAFETSTSSLTNGFASLHSSPRYLDHVLPNDSGAHLLAQFTDGQVLEMMQGAHLEST